MMSNLNNFIDSLLYLDLLILKTHTRNSIERIKVIDAIIEHKDAAKNQNPFKYQYYGLNRKNVSRFKVFAESLLEEITWLSLEKKLKFFATELISKEKEEIDDNLANEILVFFENDKRFCVERNRFCLHSCLLAKFILNSLTVILRYTNNYKNLQRALNLNEFYQPYFEEHERCQNYYNKLRYKYKDREWETIFADIPEITTHYYNTKQDLINKVNLLSYLTIYNLINKKYDVQKLLIEDVLKEISLNPYSNLKLNSMVNKFLFDDFIHMNEIQSGRKFYIEMQKTSLLVKDKHPGYLYSLGMALSLYDLENAKKFIPAYDLKKVPTSEEFILPYIASYYYLCNNLKLANTYINRSVGLIKKFDTTVYFIRTYSTYFAILFKEKKYKNIIDIYESITFRLRHIKSQKMGNLNYMLRFFYLLAQYYLNRISHEMVCQKLLILVSSNINETDPYTKLSIKKNLEIILNSGFNLNNNLRILYNSLKDEVKQMESFCKENPDSKQLS